MRISNFLLIILAALAVSCSSQKGVTNNYLYNVSDTSGEYLHNIPPALIQKNDLLAIRVFSTANGIAPAVEAPYNLSTQMGDASITGFLVDQSGNIEYPQIGVLHVEGMTTDQVAETIKDKLKEKLTQPSVIVRLLNYRITVLGEVKSPNTLNIPTEKITILEALGLVGDITEFGRKDNVKVIREVNGQRQIGIIDLTSKDFFNSPFFNLQKNDVVLVEQTRRRIKQQEQQSTLQQIGIASSILAAVALILNLIK